MKDNLLIGSEPQDRGDGNQPGMIYAANEARLTQAHFSEPLTTYATGWRDPENLEALLEFIAPRVQVARRFEYKQAVNAEEFLSDAGNADLRAIGAEFPRVEYTGSTQTAKTENRGLTIRVDHDDFPTNDPNWRQNVTDRLLRRLVRNELRRTVTAALAAATDTAKTWDNSSGKDPDQDVLTELITCTDSAGVRPNRLVYSDASWNKRMLSHRAQDTAGGFASAGLTPQQVAALFAVDEVRVAAARYVSAGAAATTKSSIVSSTVLFFYGMTAPSTEDPSNFKLCWSPCEDGTRYRVYVREEAKYTDITVESYSKLVTMSTLGLRKFTVS